MNHHPNPSTLSLLDWQPIPATARPGMRTVGLFAGIGGLELGLQRAGHRTELLCEIEPGAKKVLESRFSEVPLYDDVCTLKSLPKQTELLVAGFPCQDLSQAGKTVGIRGARSGLVGEVFRLLQRRRVPWVVLENVPFMLQLSRGRAMEVIVAAVEELGYRWAYRVVNSRAFGLPQRRSRGLFVATTEGDPRDVLFADDAAEPEQIEKPIGRLACGFYWTEGIRGLGWAVDSVPTLKGGSTIGIPSPPAILMPNGSVVTPSITDAERMQGLPAGWTEPALQVARAGHRWKLVGNAVTVDVATWLGSRLRNPSTDGRAVSATPMERKSAWPKAAFNVGQGIHTVDISSFPVARPTPHLHEWLMQEGRPLSAKATAGFLSRTKNSSLHFPDGFIRRLEKHLVRAEKIGPLVRRRKPSESAAVAST